MWRASTTPPPLWERSLTGDGEAFALLFDRHQARVHRHAHRLTPDAHAARPDLLAAVATNGVQGCFRTTEFDAAHGTGPTSPEDAAAWNARPVVVVEIPVYASDGTTVLGRFDVPTRAPGAVGVAPADRGPRAESTVLP